MKNKRGITLIALVITIIILLILAGVTIGQLTENGLFDKVKLAKEKSEQKQEEENKTLGNYENLISNTINSNRDNITISKQQLDELVNEKVSESLKVTTLSTDEIIFNEEYIDTNSPATEIKMKRSGNIISLSFSLKIKKDIPNSSIIVFSGIPKSNQVINLNSITTYTDVFSVRMQVLDSNMLIYWAGKTISTQNNNNTIEGNVVYFTQE